MSVTPPGLSLHLPERQALIDLIGAIGGWPIEAIDAVKSLGVRYVSRWEQLSGSSSVITVEQIESVINVYLFEQRKINAIALFTERMSIVDDASLVMAQAWIDAGG
jgi:hypothetical protein